MLSSNQRGQIILCHISKCAKKRNKLVTEKCYLNCYFCEKYSKGTISSSAKAMGAKLYLPMDIILKFW